MSAQYIPPPSLPLSGSPPNMAGPISCAQGTVLLPSLYWNGDTLTGFYTTGVGAIKFASGGNAVATLSATGWAQSIAGGATTSLAVSGEGGVSTSATRASTDANASSWLSNKARGTLTSLATVATNDQAGDFSFRGYGATSYQFTTRIRNQIIETSPSDTAMGGQILFQACAIGSISLTEIVRLNTASGLSMFGANPVIDANRVFRRRIFTVATLPTGVSGMASFVSDALGPTFGAAVVGGGAVPIPVYHDGTSWKVG